MFLKGYKQKTKKAKKQKIKGKKKTKNWRLYF